MDEHGTRGSRLALTGGVAAISLLIPGVVLIALIGAVLVGVNAVVAFLDEGAVPSISRLPDLPDGAEVVNEEKHCASGGCWLSLTITPPDGQSPTDLAVALGIDDSLLIPGTILQPRETFLESEPSGSDLHVILGYTDPFA